MKKIALYLGLILGGLFLFQPVFASTTYETFEYSNVNTAVCQALNDCDSNSHGIPYQTIIPTNNIIANSITIASNHYGSIMNLKWVLEISTDNFVNIVATYNYEIPSSTDGYPNVTSTQYFIFSTTTPYTLQNGITYYIRYHCDYNECGSPNYPSDNWGAITPSTSPLFGAYTSNDFKLNKTAWLNINGFSAGGSYISWKGMPTTTCDFQTWPTISTIGYLDVLTYGDSIAPVINWGFQYAPANLDTYSSIATTSFDFYTGLTSTAQLTPYGGVTKKIPLLNGAIYEATPYLVKNITEIRKRGYLYTDSYLTKGPTWNFVIIDNPGNGNCPIISPIYPTSTWTPTTTFIINPYDTEWCVNMTTNGAVEEVKKAFCLAVEYLFKPKSDSLALFSGLKDVFSQTGPFAIVSTTATILTPYTTSTIPTTTMPLVADLAPITALNTILSWGLWISYAVWVFNRLRFFKFND